MRKRTATRFIKKINKRLLYNEKMPKSVECYLMNRLPELSLAMELILRAYLRRCEFTAKAHIKARRRLARFLDYFEKTDLMRCGTAQRTCGLSPHPHKHKYRVIAGKSAPGQRTRVQVRRGTANPPCSYGSRPESSRSRIRAILKSCAGSLQ